MIVNTPTNFVLSPPMRGRIMWAMGEPKTQIAINLEWLIYDKHKTNPNAVAEATGVPQPTIHRILTGESKDPKTATVQRLADYFALTVDDLRFTDLQLAPTKNIKNVSQGPEIGGKVPVISWVKAGDFTEAVDNFHPGDADEWVDVTVPIKQHTFALRVEGDSMEPEFPPGTVIIVEPSLDALPGDYVIAKNGGDATFKQLIKDGPDWFLKPLNPRYPMKPITEAITIIGVVREAVRKFR